MVEHYAAGEGEGEEAPKVRHFVVVTWLSSICPDHMHPVCAQPVHLLPLFALSAVKDCHYTSVQAQLQAL